MSSCKVNRAGLEVGELDEGINRGNREDSTEARMEATSDARSGHVSRVVRFMDWRGEGIRCRSR